MFLSSFSFRDATLFFSSFLLVLLLLKLSLMIFSLGSFFQSFIFFQSFRLSHIPFIGHCGRAVPISSSSAEGVGSVMFIDCKKASNNLCCQGVGRGAFTNSGGGRWAQRLSGYPWIRGGNRCRTKLMRFWWLCLRFRLF